jgi:hypothetical protein
MVVAAMSTSCGSKSSSSGGGGDAPPPPDLPPVGLSANALRVDLATHTVQPGDSFECFYTDITPDHDIFANATTATQGKGGHHVTVYYTLASQPVGHHPCQDVEMATWRQIGGAGNESGGVADLPPGVGTRVPANHQIVVQTHYINATAGPFDVQDQVIVRLLDKANLIAYATSYAMVDTDFKIPAMSFASRTSSCTLTKDFDFLLMVGHMHEWGKHYKLERLDANNQVVDTLFDTEWQPSYMSHPPSRRWTLDQPYHLPTGTKVRQTCTWQNTDATEMAFPREMCVFFGTFLGDEDFLVCDNPQATN